MPHGTLHHHKVHEVHHDEKRQLFDDVATAVNVVYVTASPTFDGPILGYVTADPQATQAPAASQQGPNFFDAASSSNVQNQQTNAPAQGTAGAPVFASAAASSAAASIAMASSVPAVISAPSKSVAVSNLPTQIAAASSKAPVVSASSSAAASQSNALALATSAASSAAPTFVDSQAQATPSSASAAPVQSDPGLSAGGKAGLAIGILLAIAIIGAIAFFLYRKKQNKDKNGNADDEKAAIQQQGGGLIPRVSVRRGNNQLGGAPRLSMRPLTDMFPDTNEKVVAPAAVARGPSPVSEPAKPLTNPFADQAEAAVDASAVPKPLNISRPGTPTGSASTSLSSTSAAAIAGAAAVARTDGSGPLNVHRVQLDFAPSMEDELELHAGQLVRMLHEYDDGWALCIRLDRSQQGVVPRSCISKLPVKPRPNGPASGARGPQQGRAPLRPGQGARTSPTGSISSTSSNGSAPRQMGASPNGRMRAGSAAPAPMSGQDRSMSPAGQYRPNGPPQSRPRANSASGTAQPRRETPRQSPMNPAATTPIVGNAPGPARKPVPGQAV